MITLNGVGRDFFVGDQQVHALIDLDLTIEPGDYLSLMGPSGSGKSTLLNILGLLDRPSRGSYLLNGRNTAECSDEQRALLRREEIGFVFQFFHLVPRLTATQNVELPLLLAGVEEQQRREQVARALDSYGISDRADHRPDQLSGGQRQRVAIARATIMEPTVLLADEPTGNLDRATGVEVIALLESLQHRGITLIMVTHDPAIGERAPRRLMMVDGEVEEQRDVGR